MAEELVQVQAAEAAQPEMRLTAATVATEAPVRPAARPAQEDQLVEETEEPDWGLKEMEMRA
jgi:hypothetical protein